MKIKLDKSLNLNKNDKLLVVNTYKGLIERYGSLTKEIIDRASMELNTIIQMGFTDYFLIVADFMRLGSSIGHMPDKRFEYLNKNHKNMTTQEIWDYVLEDQSYPGLTTGPGRGSAAGSIVTYANRITNIDPLKNGLLFERFLNVERVSMPDIDSDFSKSEFEYGIRDIIIEYCAKKYGHDGICGIATPSTLSAKADIKAVGRILGSKDKNDSTAYYELSNSINKIIPNEPGVMLSDVKEDIEKQFGKDETAMKICSFAERLEGLNINYGRHACGNIIVDNRNVSAYAPLMFDDKSKQWKIQMDADTAESKGYLKMDFLGLKNLNIITKTLRLIYNIKGKNIDILSLPEDSDVYASIFSKGKTQAVFQFESDGMKSMLKRFKPTCFSDIVLLVACFRPGPMQYLDGIIARKHGERTEETAAMRIKECAPIIADTYQAIVYQEQVQQIFRKLAGYSLGQADLVRRAMGHKEEEKLKVERKAFLYGDKSRNIKGCVPNGIDEGDASQLFDEMMDFAKYAFNKSHAAAYATISYMTAYLKYHFPTEYYTCAVNFSELDKYQDLFNEARTFGVRVNLPSVNKSKDTFTCEGNNIYFAINGIKGIGDTVAKGIMDNAPYKSLCDFIIKNDLGKSKLELLIKAGCFDEFHNTRNSLLETLPYYMLDKDITKREDKKIEENKLIIKAIEDNIDEMSIRKRFKITTKGFPTIKKLNEKIEKSIKKIDYIKEHIISIPIEESRDYWKENLKNEKELLGLYISSDPVSHYEKTNKITPVSSCNTEGKFYTTQGMISNLKRIQSKKTGQYMAFFNLSDQSGTISVCMFSDSYELYENFLKEDEVISINGHIQIDKYRTTEEKTVYQIIVKEVTKPCEKKSLYLIYCDTPASVQNLCNGVQPYIDNNGHELQFVCKFPSISYIYNYKVSEEIKANYHIIEL